MTVANDLRELPDGALANLERSHLRHLESPRLRGAVGAEVDSVTAELRRIRAEMTRRRLR